MIPFFDNLSDIRLLVLDVDGVLTDNNILCTEDGHLLRTMHIRDGYAMYTALQENLQIIIITGGNSHGVTTRLKNLGNIEVFTGIRYKLPVLKKYCEENNFQANEVLYMGDDILDISVMEWSGSSACPIDAVPEVKAISQYICSNAGGKGCVREVIEIILKHQNKWYNSNL
ncbi:MAG TPA: HAD hydrolase family protein [Chitinophagales bacterium]|nr:HAD hydrolase family protein [Chitinophagales bacterium]